MDYTAIMLMLAAAYCALMYTILVYRTFRHREDYETETFHLGLCFILAVGFLHI